MTQGQETSNTAGPNRGSMTTKLIIYDLDGTLVDAFQDIANAVNHAMRLCGLDELPFEQIKSYVGDGVGALLKRALGEAHAHHLDAVLPPFLEHYKNHSSDFARLYPGVEKTLADIRAMGIQQAILTNKPQPVTDACCAKLGLDCLVDHIWGERPQVPRKPDPAAIEQVLRHFAVQPSECLMVGDGPADFDVARNGAVRVAMVTWGLATADQIAAMAPEVILERMGDLPTAL
jgi:phosphoglycolate phosphatase